MLPNSIVAALSIAGRVTLAALFLYAGCLKITSYQATMTSMTAAGITLAALLLPATIALELGAGLLVAIGRFGAASAALVLAAFTVATNVYFHNFWTMEGETARLQGSLFIKNLAIAGGLLYVAGTLARFSPRRPTEV